mgnify:CR=1 FL=1
MRSPVRPALLLPVFFASGLAGLVYEVVWTRFLSLLLGNTAHAQAVVLATFMGGLAVGYAWLGGLADRIAAGPDPARRLVRLYALLEAGIGLYGLLFPSLMKLASAGFLSAARELGMGSPALLPLSLVVAALALAIPSVLMGGTLPVLVAWAAGRPNEAGQVVSRFYAVNSAGGVVGAIVTGFFFIESLGQRGTIYFAAGLNLLLAAVSVLIAARATLTIEQSESESNAAAGGEPDSFDSPDSYNAPRFFPAAAACLCGLAALLLEVVWIRLFTLIYGSSTQSFTVIVAAFITGITLGAAWARRRLANQARPIRLIAIAAGTSAALVLLSQPAYTFLPWLFGHFRMSFAEKNAFYSFQAIKFAISFAMMVVPTVASGLLLPVAAHLGSRTPGHTGREVGRVFAWNTAGSVLGAALTGTLVIPALTLRGSLVFGAVLYLVIGLIAAGIEARRNIPVPGARGILFALAAFTIVLPLYEWAAGWNPVLLNVGEFRRRTPVPAYSRWKELQEFAKLLYYKEGPTTTVAVQELPDGNRFLKVNGKTDASSRDDILTQIGIGVLGPLYAEQLQHAMVIGFGSGATANTLLKFGLEVDVAEIEPAVLGAADLFKEINDDCLRDPHLHAHIADARTFLQSTDRAWDVIISEPSNPWVAGVGSLFTKEFFETARDRLAPGGAFVQWFHVYDMDDDMVRLILRTLGSVFPEVSVWEFESDVALVARSRPVGDEQTFLNFIEARFEVPEVRRYLMRFGVYDLFSFLSLQLAGEPGFRALLDEGPLHVDDRPLLEYRAPRAQFNRSASSLLVRHDERGHRTDLLAMRWAKTRRLTLDNMVDFTLLQSEQKYTSDAYRYLFLQPVLDGCKEPATLGRLALNYEGTHAPTQADRALAALARIEPSGARYLGLSAQLRIGRLGLEAASKDSQVLEWLGKCVKAPGGDRFRERCKKSVEELGVSVD